MVASPIITVGLLRRPSHSKARFEYIFENFINLIQDFFINCVIILTETNVAIAAEFTTYDFVYAMHS